MTLFLSDIHFGQSNPEQERATEQDLIACLRTYEADVDHLFLMGDVFDAFLEYRYLIPKGFIRFQALLAAWTDQGIPVTYLVGNHDPWHRTYFEEELGVRVVFDSCVEPLYGFNVYMAHGDGLCPSARKYNRLKPILRHPLPVWLYTHLLPADLGFGLAQWVSHTFSHDALVMETVEELRHHAQETLTHTEADLVVMGHSHYPEVLPYTDGFYMNPGAWHESRTLGRLDANGPSLIRWKGNS